MRKNILLIFLSFVCINVFAQTAIDTSKHLSFKSVPIDGSLKDYVAKMKKAGFSLSKSNGNYALLAGDFAGYKHCIVEVATLTHKDLVNKITVSFNACLNWASLLSNYTSLKDLLTEKYGKPGMNEETFQGYITDNDDSKFYNVKVDRCKYYSTFVLGKGNIHLEITQDSNRVCFIKLTYTDKLNNETIKKVALDDL
jgi:hypothetical protein